MHVVATRLLVNVQNNNVLQADMHLSPACSCHHLSLLFLYLRSINFDAVILMVIKLSHTKHHVHVTTLMQECVRFNMKGQWLQRHPREAKPLFFFVRVRSEKLDYFFLHLLFILLYFSFISFVHFWYTPHEWGAKYSRNKWYISRSLIFNNMAEKRKGGIFISHNERHELWFDI